MTMTTGRLRLMLLLLAAVSLLTGLWAGLLRMGWVLPNPLAAMVANHGPLMLSGFLGALISLERAAALQRRWAHGAPALAGLGGCCWCLARRTW